MSQTITLRGNVYGGGEVARVEGSTAVTVLDAVVPEFDSDTLLSSPKYSVFGGGLGKTAIVTGNTSVDVSFDKKGNSLFEVVGGGMNGSVGGTCNVHIGGVKSSAIYNVYGGGYYAPVGNTSLVITSGNITNDVYGGGVMGSVVGTGANDGTAATKIGMRTADADISINGNKYTFASQKNQITIGGNVYGGNDVSGSVGTAQVAINGGTIGHDVYGAGNGNHPGYTNPEYMEYMDSEHDDVYELVHGDTLYKFRPRTTNVDLKIAGNEGSDFFDAATVDKVRILGRTFGGGNSCNVGNWNDDGSFDGYGTLSITIGNHVQLGTQSDSHEEPNGLFMGSNGQYLVTQPKQDDPEKEEKEKYYHYYYDSSYKSGFADGDEESFKAFVDNILTWTDDVQLNFADDVEDVWMSNFVGGGFRGSMKAKTASGKFHYSLPEGLTVANTVIGGAFNANVDYFKPESTEPTYSFKGGILAADDADRDSRIHSVHADPRNDDAEYATSYFMPLQKEVPDAEDEATRAKLYNANKEKAFVYLDLKCALHPVGIKGVGDEHSVQGGNVYGGCFESGNIEGDTWVNYGCYLSSLCEQDPLYDVFFNKKNNLGIYGEVSDLDRNNALNIFGAGYGAGTRSMGDVYLCIQSIASQATGDDNPSANFPYIFNAFGGSNMGTVAGNVNVYYDSGVQGTLLGSLYGGGYKGKIDGNTFVELASGFVVNVFGGSRQANIGGASHVWAYDGKYRGVPNSKHLIICNMYGGNDVAGVVEGAMPAEFTAAKWDAQHGLKSGTITGKKFNSYVEVSSDDNSVNKGFPLIGRVFAGGNGAEWEAKYGDKPEVANAIIEIAGGTTLQAFGGGNKATITEGTYIFANAATDKFADVTFTEYQKNIMNKVFFAGVPAGYKWDKNRLTMDPFHVVRMFGGNNLATMDIQPTWNLVKGRLENVYSGGNMGDMTYYNPGGKPATQKGVIGQPSGVENNADKSNANYNPRGLSITIDQPDIHIGSLFGGCRISNVNPTPKVGQPAWPEGNDGEDFYGATINVLDGYIENIYGGNDISGKVYHGTNVNLSGAVSGNVYGSGNGFYIYKYDKNATALTEKVSDESDGKANYLYYEVPGEEGASDTKKLLAINSIRPSVEKAFLNISGNAASGTTVPKRVAYVKGNVYCGGNASTVEGEGSFTKFKIGSYVTLNGVFMGCDGEAYSRNEEIAKFAEINEIADMGASTVASDFPNSDDASHNPILLNVYMKAVDMKALPKDFNLNKQLTQAHIGTFCGGGNRGSMLVDKTVSLSFHHSLLIYDKIVAGCMNARVVYNQNGKEIVSNGGFTRAIADNATYGNTKMNLTIASQFIPVVMDVPADKNPATKNSHKENFEDAEKHNFLYSNFSDGEIWDYEEFNEIYEGHWTSQEEFEESGESFIYKVAPGVYAPTCNIYGGCYQSGDIVGDVNIKLHSNMLRYVNQSILEESNASHVACFNVYGAGFGQNSHVWGNVNITMDRSLDRSLMGSTIAARNLLDPVRTQFAQTTSLFNIKLDDKRLYSNFRTNGDDNPDASYPSANNVFGGGRNGQLIGNSTIEVRNGLVFSDIVGGCYASDMYGSSQVVVGYPKYYQCKSSAKYDIKRGDKWNEGKKDVFGDDVVKKSVYYLKGDLVPENVYQQIVEADGSKAAKFDLIDVDPTTYHTEDGTTWDAVHINVVKGVYGGGYSIANATAASAGAITTLKLTNDNVGGYFRNFNGRYGYDIADTKGYGGNSNVMVGDQENGTVDHIRISTLIPTKATVPSGGTVLGLFVKESDGRYTFQGDGPKVAGKTYYKLTGDGGIYGDGHLTFCEGFRAADITRYGWAKGTPMHPIILNTFQRLDLLSVNDCCLMLMGAQDFATDQLDGTTYSVTRVNELRLNSSLDPDSKFGEISTPTNAGGAGNNYNEAHQRNYLAFLNNVRYLGSIVTNDDFDDDHHAFHGADGSKGTKSYKEKKNEYIKAYSVSTKNLAATAEFKKRNVGTARNAIGVNNGYSLRIQNLEYVGEGDSRASKTYYGPIVGVCEIKLLSVVEGEGGGYVYADNIHKDENHFLNTSGNFVFPGIVNTSSSSDDKYNQYIVDDCFLNHFGSKTDLTTRVGDLDEAHYWYVEGNKYFFNTTLTGFTYKDPIDFNLIENDPNIILSGMDKGSKLNVKKIEWLSTHRAGYETVLQNKTNPNYIEDYEFDLQVGGIGTNAWSNDMPRHSKGSNTSPYTTGKTYNTDALPQFNIRLQDKLDNSGKANYDNHLDEPELVKIYLTGQTLDENGTWQDYEYTINLNIVYLLGPTFDGGVDIENCALPGEMIGFSSNGIRIRTSEMMPVISSGWKIVPLTEIDEHGEWKWDINNGVDIPESMYKKDEHGALFGAIPALYKQNEYNIAYVFTAGGKNFPVFPVQRNLYSNVDEYNAAKGTSLTKEQFAGLSVKEKIESIPNKEKRMIVVHNYHRMKDVVAHDLQIEKMQDIPNHDVNTKHAAFAEAKIYIEDEEDLRAFVNYLNMSAVGNAHNIPAGLEDLDIILQKDITLTKKLPAISKKFKGTFHGDGYHIDLNGKQTLLFGNMLDGKVYNLGLIGGTIASTGQVVNSYDSKDFSSKDIKDGAKAYKLSHVFNPATDHDSYDDYVGTYYANGDYQYASNNRAWSLRTGSPNYGQTLSSHDASHFHDDARWNETEGVNIPLYDGKMTLEDRKGEIDGVSVYYKGIAEGYANDYLFFGQHLDKENADAYPMHINQVATGDANEDKGGNRVFETAGFYQSKVDKKFYYNKDAWALDPTLTAIDYTSMTSEGDKAVTIPTKFSVDSNKDAEATAYSNTNYGHVTQNLLVYNSGEKVFDKKDVKDIAESNIVYHNIVKGSDSKFSTSYFHLVDKQDFNAPIAFNVGTRAWYERQPLNYRDGSAMAWEGICIPFTAKKVFSMVENPNGGADLASVISHFYGEDLTCEPKDNDHTLHHEYWLNGMVGAASGVTFARPSTNGEGLFTYDKQEAGNYVFQNDYFVKLPNYEDYYGTRDDDVYGSKKNQAWYDIPHTFADYVYLSNDVPYVVAFPGEDYYEFNLTNPVVFENNKATIKVSDDEKQSSVEGSYSHVGTYLHRAMYAKDYVIDAEGNGFENVTGDVVTLPFRTYINDASSLAKMRYIAIGDFDIEDEPEEDYSDGKFFKVYGRGGNLVIEANFSGDFRIYNTSGQFIRTVHVENGVNNYNGFNKGVYIVNKKKIAL